jgi:RES domain-containing protein
VRLWRIAGDGPDYEAHELTGKGAEQAGGRWNRVGSPVVYASTTISLAALETLVNFTSSGIPMNRFLVSVDVPDKIWSCREAIMTPPVGWTATPPGKVSVELGENWLKRRSSALLLVPSVIVHEEYNVLVNPRHPHCSEIRAHKIRPWVYDLRAWVLPNAAQSLFARA